MRLQVVYTEALESPRLFRRKTLNSTQGKGTTPSAWFFWQLCWCQQKLILPQRNKAANGVRLVPKAPVVLTWSLHFLRAFLVACGFGTTGFSLEEQICIARCGSPLFRGVPKSIWIAVPKRERGGAFLREQEPGAIAAERSLVLSNWASPNGLADPLGLEQLEL